MAKKDCYFLDPAQQHILSEQECELITFFRALNGTKRQTVMQALFAVLLNDDKSGNPKKEAQEE